MNPLLQKSNMKLSDLIEHYTNVLNEFGDMSLAILHLEHRDEDGWWIPDKYETVDSYYVGYPKEVYYYGNEYATDLPYEEQKNDKRMLYIIDET